jgi:hypothetical protein
MTIDRLNRLRNGWRKAFALEGPFGPLTDVDRDLLARLARTICVRQMAMPAILFLTSVRPLNALGSQAMVFLRPFLVPIFNEADYDRMTAILDRREGIEALIDAIEGAQALDKDSNK